MNFKTRVLTLLLFIGLSLSSNAQCPTPPGDQTSYGSGSWIGYVYNAVNTSNPPTNAFTTTYRGYITQTEIFNQDLGSGAVSGANLCGTYSDQFAIRFKMTKNFAPGNYSFQVGGDDGFRLSFDGGATFPISRWNDQSYAITTGTYYLSGTTNLVLEYYEQGGLSRVSFSYGICSTVSTTPTSITGTSTICSGNTTTLTATGGTTAFGVTYEWGTGTTVGSNIIAGQNAASITVAPSTTTTYWVRRVDPAPCTYTTGGITQTVTVNQISTAPTSLSGTTTLCLGSSTTLTATGGTLAPGGVYEWGTGAVVGSNSIAGQTGSTLTVTPTTTTTYWVRRVDAAPCASATAGVTTTVTVNIPAGNQTTYGTGAWIGYVYADVDGANPPTNAFTTNYRGYITQPEIFDQDLTTNPLTGANLCGSYADKFAIRFKMTKNFTAGYYTFTVGGDDGYRLSLDGGATFAINNFVDHAYTSTTGTTVYLSGATNLVLEYYEQGGYSRVNFNYTSCTNFSTAPTAISGSSNLCYGAGGTTLTATGGFANPSTTYQWGTGTVVGSNVISGVTTASYYINPSATTTYWVRRVDPAPCNQTTTAALLTVTVATASTMPTAISVSATTVCSGSAVTLTASGGTMGTGAAYQWGTGYTAGVNIIAGQTSASIVINPTATSGYWVRRVDPTPCNTVTGQITTTVNVAVPPTNPTAITGTTALCTGSTVALTATGGNAGTNGVYQWGTGSVVGANIIAGQSYYIMYVNPTATTTYWVRIVDTAPCSATTAGVTQTVTVATPSTAPTSISSSASTTCTGVAVTLTANGGTTGTNAVYQWGTGTVGSNIIAGESNATLSVAPTTGTTYWVRRIDPAPCSTQTAAVTKFINVVTISTAPTGISGTTSICNSGSTTLTATGGALGATGTYQWGTGSVVGANIIAGQTSSSLTTTVTSTTTYWVRRSDSGCSNVTGGVTQLITVYAPTIAGTLSAAITTICANTTPSNIVLSGNNGNVVKWQYATNAAFTTGVTDIASTSTTLSSALMGTFGATRYFRAVVQNGNCSIANTTPIQITVSAPVTYNGSWSGTPTATTPVTISGNLTLTSDLNVCSCQVTGSAVVTVPSGKTLTVQKNITVDPTANIIVENEGSLIQVDDNATDIGTITFKRNTTPLKQYDYTYWSSPLAGQALNVLGSPSLFYSYNASISNWAYELGTNVMTPAKGYIARVPNNLNFATPQVVATTFNGVPNNGVINAPIVKNDGTTYNLIGNPYPSAIDIDAFLLDPANSSIVNGTIYLWTHNTAISSSIPGNQVFNYTRDDYAKYNLTGGVKTASSALSGGVTPTGKVASGQGFFIEANDALSNGTYQATFNNSMRVAGNNNVFFKTTSPAATSSTMSSALEKNRVWLHVSNTDGAYDETLVGYITGATDGLDNLFDGKTLVGGNVVSLYSLLDTNTLAIQGRSLPFNIYDVVPLGFRTTLTGNFTIGLEHFDGLFENQNIYLLDKTTNVYYDLKAQSYTFNIETSGTFDNRFELRFTNGALSNNDFTSQENGVQIIKQNKHIAVKSTSATISKIEVFDLLGKSIYRKNSINANEFNSSDLFVEAQMLIVKVTLENNVVVNQKVFMN